MKPYYEIDGITIYHGDNRQILPALPEFDLCLTDPPYGIGEAAGRNKSRSKIAVSKDYGNSDWDNSPPEDWLFGLMRAKSTSQIIFGGNYFTLPPSSCWLVWDKLNGDSDFADCELAWTNLPRAVRRIRWQWAGMLQENMARKEHREHPTQKPLGVIQWALSMVPEAKTVVDPFMGSGTTLVACKNMGVKCVGIEREEKYCEVAAKRLGQSVMDFGGAA